MASKAQDAVSARALRFASRLRGDHEPTFAELTRQTQADRSAAENGTRVAMALSLLQAKPALDRELSGARLQAFADLIGDDLLDALREADVTAVAADILVPNLPPPAALAPQGEYLLANVGKDARIADLARIAIALVRGTQVAA